MDGDRVRDVPRQLQRIPQGATHFFLSIGGNDALDRVELLNRRVETVGRGISLLGREVDGFEEEYRALVDRLREDLPWLQLCTVYNGDFGPEAPMVIPAIRLFNDAIQRVANENGLPVVELRSLLNRPEHYANPIEPSVEGGRVLAAELLRRAREAWA